MNLIIILRGHERGAFNNQKLNQFIVKLSKIFVNCRVHIHTWNKTEASKSWRKLECSQNSISELDVHAYFDVDVSCVIDNEEKVVISGKKRGKIGAIPLICWKMMWYGQYRVIEDVYNWCDSDTIIMNMRIDFFSCKTTLKYQISEEYIVSKCRDAIKEPEKIVFLHENGEYDGIDNLYIGNAQIMRSLIHRFHFHLDRICLEYDYLIFHESMVYYEAMKLVGKPVEHNKLFYYVSLVSNQMKTFFV